MFKLEFTGTGGALPLKNRGMSAALLSYNGRKILFDCGEGTQQALLRLRSGFANIDIICLSHLHGDHVFGLAGLLCTMGVAGRNNDLLLLAPEGSGSLLSKHLALVGSLPYSVYVLEAGDYNLAAAPTRVFAAVPDESSTTGESTATGESTSTGADDDIAIAKGTSASHPDTTLDKQAFAEAAAEAIAFKLTNRGYKLDLQRSHPERLNSKHFYCLLKGRKDGAINKSDAEHSTPAANAAATKEVNASAAAAEALTPTADMLAPTADVLAPAAVVSGEQLKRLYPTCTLFSETEAAKLQKAGRLNKKLSRYDALEIKVAGKQPTDLYISTKRQKHSVPCIAFRLDWFKQGVFSASKACLHGVPKEFWSLLQNNHEISYYLQDKYFHFYPEQVTDQAKQFFSFCYVTDSRPLAANKDFLSKADLLVSEANYAEEDKLPLAVKNMHMTMKEACTQAAEAEVKELVLTHFSAGLTDPDAYLPYAETFFPGVNLAHDLDEFNFFPPNRQASSYSFSRNTASAAAEVTESAQASEFARIKAAAQASVPEPGGYHETLNTEEIS